MMNGKLLITVIVFIILLARGNKEDEKMKDVIVSGFYFDFLVQPIELLEKEGYIFISKWIVGDDSKAVKHTLCGTCVYLERSLCT